MSFKTQEYKHLEWFWPVTEGITLLIWKKIIKHYTEKLIFNNFKSKKKPFKKYTSGQK